MSTTNEIMGLIIQVCDFPATEIEIRRFCLSKGVPAPEINYAMDQALAFGWITLLDPEEPQAQYAATKMGRNSQDALQKPERAPSSDSSIPESCSWDDLWNLRAKKIREAAQTKWDAQHNKGDSHD
jgi:hypothetical protein